jgi:hypothetical protein
MNYPYARIRFLFQSCISPKILKTQLLTILLKKRQINIPKVNTHSDIKLF